MELTKDDVRVISESLALFAERYANPQNAADVMRLAKRILTGQASDLTTGEVALIDSTLRIYREDLDSFLESDDPSERDAHLEKKKAVNAVLRKLRKALPPGSL